jgi:sugar transferase (PEP-CTERM/EpsH1 system associated)
MAACLAEVPAHITRIADYVDLESAKRRQRATARRWPARLVDQRAARRLQDDEDCAANDVEHVLFASAASAALFAGQAPRHAAKAVVVANGVDADYFSPYILHRSPFAPGCRPLVFAGAMDDWANAEGAAWFARHVFPALHRADPALRLYLAGSRPCARVRALGRARGVVVSGAVADVRPYLAHAALVVAPLRHAYGVQNTILEAIAMQKPVLATPAALSGLAIEAGTELLQAAPDRFGAAVQAALADPSSLIPLARAARQRVLRDYGWSARLERLAHLLGASAPAQAGAGGHP